jgi:hypothetical protein
MPRVRFAADAIAQNFVLVEKFSRVRFAADATAQIFVLV